MRTERQTRIGLLSRASKGKAMLPAYLAALSRATACEIVPAMLTELSERDLALEHFRMGYQQARSSGEVAFSKTYSADRRDRVFGTTTCLAEGLDEEVLLLTKESEYCGAVKVNGAIVLRHCAEVLALDGDAVMVLSKDHSQGLLLDFTAAGRRCCYELTIWGDRWALGVLSCAD